MNIASYQARDETSFNQGSRGGSNDHVTPRQEESHHIESRDDSHKSRDPPRHSRDVHDVSFQQRPSDIALQSVDRPRTLTEETDWSRDDWSRDDEARETKFDKSMGLEIQTQGCNAKSLHGQSSITAPCDLDFNDKVSRDNCDVACDVTQSNNDGIKTESLKGNVSETQTCHLQDAANSICCDDQPSDNIVSKTQEKILNKSSKMQCSFKVGNPNEASQRNTNGGFSRDEEKELNDVKPSVLTKATSQRRVKNKRNKDSNKSSASLTERLRKISRELRESNGTRSCLVVSMIFVVCWIPRCLLNIFRLFLPHDRMTDGQAAKDILYKLD
ncbi:hypothetical protein AC249_AIPGENE9943 [Exaiptasia diaphana]|nr:hypothetical protein AC249_AIPGENE9943 [Exaiptasia diaphana]